MIPDIQSIILKSLNAEKAVYKEKIQTLWSGYGEIARYQVFNGDKPSVILKHVKLPEEKNHPRGWNTDISHQRKIKSYQVESNWYQEFAELCDDNCRVPKCYAVEKSETEFLILLEDLDFAGYPVRLQSVSIADMKVCLKWLANFHSRFLTKDDNDKQASRLWQIGTYWHLDTRPDELDALDDLTLKNAAREIDDRLNQCEFKTLVHGDAKLANFCFSEDSHSVAAVDFQYVGVGCGMKDIAYFIGSCLYEEDCERFEQELLNYYFTELKQAVANNNSGFEFSKLEKEWREMYPFAWADFHRFLKGWSPGHWKINSYSEKLTKRVIKMLKEKDL